MRRALEWMHSKRADLPPPRVQAQIAALPTFPPSRAERATGLRLRIASALIAAGLVAYCVSEQTLAIVGPLGHVVLTGLGLLCALICALHLYVLWLALVVDKRRRA